MRSVTYALLLVSLFAPYGQSFERVTPDDKKYTFGITVRPDRRGVGIEIGPRNHNIGETQPIIYNYLPWAPVGDAAKTVYKAAKKGAKAVVGKGKKKN